MDVRYRGAGQRKLYRGRGISCVHAQPVLWNVLHQPALGEFTSRLVNSSCAGWWTCLMRAGEVALCRLVNSPYAGWWTRLMPVGELALCLLVKSPCAGWWNRPVPAGPLTNTKQFLFCHTTKAVLWQASIEWLAYTHVRLTGRSLNTHVLQYILSTLINSTAYFTFSMSHYY